MVLIIAEIGQNFCGDLLLAKDLIRLAKENGADLAKFQLFNPDALYEQGTIDYKEAKESELTLGQAKMLFEYGKTVGIEVFFSVFDVERVKWCEKIGVERYKIAGTLKDWMTVREVILTGKPIISSSPYQSPDFPMKMLLCVNKYPASLADYHLAENKFGEFYDGISDHTIGLDTAKIAMARGARIVEKHFAIDHRTGDDAPWSMTPDELKELKRWEKIISVL